MDLDRCKGFNDLTSEDMKRFRLVEDVFLMTCGQWGYEEIRTPTLEYLHLFTQAGTLTPGMLRRAYSFLDWDGWTGSRVVMRPDNTIPTVRHYINAYGEGVARLCYSTPIYVFDVNEGKNRERLQLGCELIGEGGALADTELIKMSLEILSSLGASEIKVILSHAGVVRATLESMGLSAKEREDVFDAILNGKREQVREVIKDQVRYQRIESLLSVKGTASAYIKNLTAVEGKENPYIQELIDLCDMLTSTGVNFEIDFTVGKGFEYYTGVMFRLFADGVNVGGGGRYNRLIPILGGEQTPAAGFALYVDCLMNYVDEDDVADIFPRVQINYCHGRAGECFELASLLRDQGFCAVINIHTSIDNCESGFNYKVNLAEDNSYEIEGCAEGTLVCKRYPDEVVKYLAGLHEQL